MVHLTPHSISIWTPSQIQELTLVRTLSFSLCFALFFFYTCVIHLHENANMLGILVIFTFKIKMCATVQSTISCYLHSNSDAFCNFYFHAILFLFIATFFDSLVVAADIAMGQTSDSCRSIYYCLNDASSMGYIYHYETNPGLSYGPALNLFEGSLNPLRIYPLGTGCNVSMLFQIKCRIEAIIHSICVVSFSGLVAKSRRLHSVR